MRYTNTLDNRGKATDRLSKTLPYSDGEIVELYKHAKNKKNAVNILSEMNICSKREIISVLERKGIQVNQQVIKMVEAKEKNAAAGAKQEEKETQGDGKEGVKRREQNEGRDNEGPGSRSEEEDSGSRLEGNMEENTRIVIPQAIIELAYRRISELADIMARMEEDYKNNSMEKDQLECFVAEILERAGDGKTE